VRTAWKIVKMAVVGFARDEIIVRSAALAFYAILSFAPLLILLVTATSWLGSAQRQQVVDRVESLVGPEGGRMVDTIIEHAQARQEVATTSAIVGLVATLLAAMGALIQLHGSLNRIFKVRVSRGFIFGWLWKRFLSLLMILLVGVVLAASLIVSSVISAMIEQGSPVWQVINVIITLLVYTAVFMTMLKVLPDVELTWKDAAFGGALTAVMFMVGTYGIGRYLGRTSRTSVYGAAGSLVILLLWVYYSSIIIFFGAELTSAYTEVRGRLPRPDGHAEQVPPVSHEPKRTGAG
jgi:membrane protein